MAATPTPVDDEGPIAVINVIPFVDISLVLLVIFMLTSVTIVRSSFEVDLPTAASGGAAVTSTLNVAIAANGQLYSDGRPVEARGLADITRKMAAQNHELQAVVAADKAVAYGSVIAVIDVLKSNGVKAFALNIERGRPEGAL
ncbi:MAG: ExbD/TolR family protein [Polyangiales bacterium]